MSTINLVGVFKNPDACRLIWYKRRETKIAHGQVNLVVEDTRMDRGSEEEEKVGERPGEYPQSCLGEEHLGVEDFIELPTTQNLN